MAEAVRLSIERLQETQRRIGKKHSSYYDDVEAGLFPPSIPVGKRARGHFAHETDAVLAARGSGATDDQLRALVRDLLADCGKLARKPKGRA